MNEIPLTDWMDALVSAVNELATTSLGFEEGSLVAEQPLRSSLGSCVALVGDECSLQIGMGGSQENCMKLARALFGLESEDEDPSEQDLADALGEMANVVAGGVKTRMHDHAASMRLGLPLVMHGYVDAPGGAEVATATIRWDSVEAQLLLMRPGNGKG